MVTITEKIQALERQRQKEFAKPRNILDREAKILFGKSMADLYLQCEEQELDMITMPQIALARVNVDMNKELGTILWKYNWMTSSNLGRLEANGKDYGVFTHGNIFGNAKERIAAYQRTLRTGGLDVPDEEAKKIIEMNNGHDVIVVPFQQIRQSPRGVISLRDVCSGKRHVVVDGSLGNDISLVDAYIIKYINVMQKSPFTPLEIGVWFSEDAGINTIRPLEIGDSGIGIYTRNLTNKEYRTIGLKKNPAGLLICKLQNYWKAGVITARPPVHL